MIIRNLIDRLFALLGYYRRTKRLCSLCGQQIKREGEPWHYVDGKPQHRECNPKPVAVQEVLPL